MLCTAVSKSIAVRLLTIIVVVLRQHDMKRKVIIPFITTLND